MAKKRKKFQKSQLLSVFANGNYQKVISKIKQFEIDGMDEDELLKIQLTSYEKLVEENFQGGDIARAIRDIESLISISDSIEYRLKKLKYLCYIEYFADAVVFAEELILSKNQKIKKESIFFYLLAQLYIGNYEIEPKQLKLLSATRQNYILAMRELFGEDKERALVYLESCKPRAKVEKENIKAIKSLILNQEMHCSQTLKPLYRFLLCMDSDGLQNTKNSRIIKKELTAQFATNKKERDMNRLISLEGTAPIESILKSTSNKKEQTKLIYNNIVLVMKKEKDPRRALELFVKYRSDLLELVESAILYINIDRWLDDMHNDKIIMPFFSSYLKLHHHKLSPFQLDYIFFFLLTQRKAPKYIALIEEYGGGDAVFLMIGISLINSAESNDQETFERVFRKYSQVKQMMTKQTIEQIKSIDHLYDELDPNGEKISQDIIYFTSILLANLEKPHKGYKKILFELLSTLALVCQSLDLKKEQKIYTQLSKSINRLIEYYAVPRVELSIDIKALFVSIDQKKRIKLSILSDMYGGHASDTEDRYNFNEMEYDILYIEKDFIDALIERKRDPFTILKRLKSYRYNNKIFKLILNLIVKTIEVDRYSDSFMDDLLDSTSITLSDEYIRGRLLSEVKDYASSDPNTALIFLRYAIDSVSPTHREYLWYLKWIVTYIDLIDTHKISDDRDFDRYLQLYLQIQNKKKFKSQKATLERFMGQFARQIKIQGGLFD
ncbi:MAG: hypothetical protein DRG30_07070 [Epsilonproteobacteria bacterium]|nr:MAG: hypothetical protein DRG30_07070 [Campylobacterota bacterium]